MPSPTTAARTATAAATSARQPQFGQPVGFSGRTVPPALAARRPRPRPGRAAASEAGRPRRRTTDGLPRSRRASISDQQTANRLEGGQIRWWRSTSASELGPAAPPGEPASAGPSHRRGKGGAYRRRTIPPPRFLRRRTPVRSSLSRPRPVRAEGQATVRRPRRRLRFLEPPVAHATAPGRSMWRCPRASRLDGLSLTAVPILPGGPGGRGAGPGR